MRILSLLYTCFMVLDYQVISLPAPENITVKSKNFNIMLEWSPGEDTPLGTVYNVQIGKKTLQNITGTIINISEYIKDIFKTYTLQLWASNDSGSSPKESHKFSPFQITTIGPPSFTLSGCGDCLNISISLPKPKYILEGDYNSFYNNIYFNIHWRKAEDETDGCTNSVASEYQKIMVQSNTHVLEYLQRGERYCVQVQPQSTSVPDVQTSCWICEFTSIKEPRGVAYLVGWVIGFVSLVLCLLILTVCVVYTGFLCKPKRRLPKALVTLAPAYILYLEEVCPSIADVECSLKKNEAKDFHQQHTSIVDDNNDEENKEEEESHHGYMDRAGNGSDGEAESTESDTSDVLCKAAKIYGNCSLEGTLTPTEPQEIAPCCFQNSLDKDHENRTVCSESANENVHPPESKREGKVVEQKRENNQGGFKNVNLLSVTLKSMQQKDEEMDETDESREPLLSSLLKELHDDALASKPQTESSSFSELPTACLLRRDSQTESQNRHEEQTDLLHTDVCDRTQTGYLATHIGTIDTESDSSEEDEEENTSDYMTR
ncbi:cytokine receptor family member b1 [Trichomycterus rosablanca]|uniref:cytokine receptor family member b1 n=1 Tax=Trichomycterus rosablanca TaxID=2290929 RepID=UPI002F354619